MDLIILLPGWNFKDGSKKRHGKKAAAMFRYNDLPISAQGTISVKTGNVTPNIKGKYVFGNVRNIFPPELAESIESGIRAMGKDQRLRS